METVTTCPVCGNSQFKPFLVCKDYLVSQQEFTIQQCQSCNFRLTNPRPDQLSIGAYYKSDQYVSHNDQGGGLINSVYRFVRTITLKQKLQLITTLTGGTGKLLDIGCGTGAFLDVSQQAGWTIKGVEPDPDARAIASHKTKISIQPDLAAIDQEQVDMITMWHVLEHVPTLNETIEQIHSRLAPNGTLLIAVPNSDSYDASYYKQYWAAYDVPRHLYHFTPDTIERLFNKHGFNLTGKRPMIFDAFYIAMLSSRYRSGQTHFVESLRIGLVSNMKSGRKGHSSSQIYIFKKA
ncbi:2-polyprenyl-3-methyl-5-hydroxy-6-metoxy-1,4-benzoquinol methylase [Spirosoma lacussanchae]|uniref:class I SAM-dependent methyltransferase n=1 Tax=Spirosoma lacussanchae TaxID=1884249 RepID=UPI001FEB7CD2|nr:class I SAM-dependent methyltransferase [Spirosoma lacussanchae]